MIRLFRYYISSRKVLFVLGEGVLIYGVVTIAAFVMDVESDFGSLLEENWWRILLVMILTQLSLYFNDLYDLRSIDNTIEMTTLLLQAIGITSILLAIVYFLWQGAMIGRWVFIMSFILLILILVSWRILYIFAIHKKLFVEKALILGNGELARDLLQEIRNRRDITFDIRALLMPQGENAIPVPEGIPLRTGFENLCQLAEDEEVSSIIVALDQKRGVMPYNELLNCKMKGFSIVDGETFYERITGKLLVERIRPSWLIFSDGFVKSKTSKFTKRLIGLILSVVLLILFSPLFLIVAIAIKIDSRGSVLFKQERVGENGLLFSMYKFRSMRADAEKISGPVWAEENDPRITRVGKVIRRLRIDEFPQLWNVLKGEMSFVGPRPERPYFVKQLRKLVPYYSERFTVKPGVTGWAQTRYGYGGSEQDALEKLKYDLYYIKNMSIVMDCLVLFQTVKTVLLGRGSR